MDTQLNIATAGAHYPPFTPGYAIDDKTADDMMYHSLEYNFAWLAIDFLSLQKVHDSRNSFIITSMCF